MIINKKLILLFPIFLFLIISCKADNKCLSFYKIKKGDDCFNISVDHGISLSKFETLNPGINCGNLVHGTKVCVKANLSLSQYLGKSDFEGNPNFKSKRSETGSQTDEDNTDFYEVANNVLSEEESMEIKQEFKKIYELTGEIKDYIAELVDSNNSLENFDIDVCKKKCRKLNEEYVDILINDDNALNIENLNLIYYKLGVSNQITEKSFINFCLSTCIGFNEVKEMFNKDEINELSDEKNKVLEDNEIINGDTENENYDSPKHSFEKREEPNFKCSKQKNLIHYKGPSQGIKYYNRAESVYSGMLRSGWVDGFSDPVSEKLGIKSNYKAVFEPAGYGHDSCYFCKNSKSGCDESLLGNMSKLCWSFYKGYNFLYNPLMCEDWAAWVYGIISIASQSSEGYNNDQEIILNKFNKVFSLKLNIKSF